jgi:hypothetical protein
MPRGSQRLVDEPNASARLRRRGCAGFREAQHDGARIPFLELRYFVAVFRMDI